MMINLITKEELTNKDLQTLDLYFFGEHLEELLLVDNKYIKRFIDLTEKNIGICLTKCDLEVSLRSLSLEYKLFFNIDDIYLYDKVLDLINYYSFIDLGLAYVIGDYYYYENNKIVALKYYEMIFKKGFNLCNEGYIDSLCRYLELIDDDVCKLEELINNSKVDDYSVEFIDVYLLLLHKLDKNSLTYLDYLDLVINKTKPLVRKHQKNRSADTFISDSDIERNYCELLALKMEYYLIIKDYINCMKMYNELTDEIYESDCVRYYHARDLFYNQMLKDMSKDYPILNFFNDIESKTFKIKSDQLDINSEIILENELGECFNFKVVNIYNNSEYVIAPILPLLGIGGVMFMTKVIINGKKYFKNKL